MSYLDYPDAYDPTINHSWRHDFSMLVMFVIVGLGFLTFEFLGKIFSRKRKMEPEPVPDDLEPIAPGLGIMLREMLVTMVGSPFRFFRSFFRSN